MRRFLSIMKPMEGFTAGQRRLLAEFFSNLSVAWFSAGVISPFFTKPGTLVQGLILPIGGMFFGVLFLDRALALIERDL